MVLNIIHDICSLKGDTLGDILKKFSEYITDNNDAIICNIEDLLSSFIPENNLHKLFRLYLIDKFQRKSDLLSIFEGEDIFYTTRALNCKWFFTNIDSIVLVNDILPNFSYNNRQKMLKNYGKYLKDSNEAEEIYRAVQQRYGIKCALKILPACSAKFVSDILHNNIDHIQPEVITRLFKLYPDLIVDWILVILDGKKSKNQIYNNFSFDGYSGIFKFIASKYPEQFIKMCTYSVHLPFFKIGNRVTRKLVTHNFSILIQEWNHFNKFIYVKHMKRHLTSSQIEDLQYAQFPISFIELFQDYSKLKYINDFTSHLDERMRQEIFLRNFQINYGKELNVNELFKLINLLSLIFIPSEMRLEWAQLALPTYETDSGKAECLSYLPPDFALPALKELIVKQQEFEERSIMVQYMLLSSKRYQSHKALIECISFIVKRLRNDNIKIREVVFEELANMKDLLHKLTNEEWATIDELINIVKMNDETFRYGCNFKIILHIRNEWNLLNGKPVEHMLKESFNFEMENYSANYFKKLGIGGPYHKKCLEFAISALPSESFKVAKWKEHSHITLFQEISEYNLLNKKDKLEFPNWLLVFIENLLMDKNQQYYLKHCLIKTIRKNPDLKDRIYTKIFDVFPKKDNILYILQKKPWLIKERKEALIKSIVNYSVIHEYIPFFKRVTVYSFLDLPQILTEKCLNVLKAGAGETDKNNSKPNAMIFLSILISTKDFIALATPYKPTKEKLEGFTDESKLEYKIQKAVASSLKHVALPYEILTYMKSFAVGDYLKLVVGSINSICLKISEKKILPLLEQWVDCPVSLRKHWIKNYYKIAPKVKTEKWIGSLLAQEKNASIRLILFEIIHKYFLAEPCEETFAFFKAGFSQLIADNIAEVDALLDLRCIPNALIPQYVQILWKAVELKKNIFVAKYKTMIINLMNPEQINLLDETFCDLLLEYAFTGGSLIQLKKFVTIYLLHATNETSQMFRLEKILNYIEQMVQKDWNGFNFKRTVVFETREGIYSLIECICRQSLELEINIGLTNILERLKLFMQMIVPHEEIIHQLLLIETTTFIIDNHQSGKVAELAEYYDKQLTYYCPIYGDHLIDTMVYQMPSSLEKFKLHLAKYLLCERTSYQAHLMALKLISTNIHNNVQIYEIIVEFLLKCTNSFVKTAVTEVLRKLKSHIA